MSGPSSSLLRRALHTTRRLANEAASGSGERAPPTPGASFRRRLGVGPQSASPASSAASTAAAAASAAAATAGSTAYSRPITPNFRSFSKGQYYSPRTLNLENLSPAPADVSARQQRRVAPPLLGPGRKEAEKKDALHKLGLYPGHPSLHDDSYKNPVLLANYVTDMGKIKPRNLTGLTRRSQREVGKAIRRARSMGLMPVLSKKGIEGWKGQY